MLYATHRGPAQTRRRWRFCHRCPPSYNNLLRGIRLLRPLTHRRGTTRPNGAYPSSSRVFFACLRVGSNPGPRCCTRPTEDRRKHEEDGDSAIDTRQVTNDLFHKASSAFRLHHQGCSQSTPNRPSNDTPSSRVFLLHVFELVQTRAQDVVRDPPEDRRKHEEDGDSAIDTRQVTNNFFRLCGKRRLRETERGRGHGRHFRRFDLRFVDCTCKRARIFARNVSFCLASLGSNPIPEEKTG